MTCKVLPTKPNHSLIHDPMMGHDGFNHWTQHVTSWYLIVFLFLKTPDKIVSLASLQSHLLLLPLASAKNFLVFTINSRKHSLLFMLLLSVLFCFVYSQRIRKEGSEGINPLCIASRERSVAPLHGIKWWLWKKSKSELKLGAGGDGGKRENYTLLSQIHLKDTNPSLCSWLVTRACYSHSLTPTLSLLICWGRVWQEFSSWG